MPEIPARGAAAKAAGNRAALKSVPTGAGEEKQEPAKKASPAKKAPAKATAPAEPKGNGAVTIAEQRAAKARQTNAEAKASGATQKCAGPCAQTKPITAFPTTARRPDGTMGRGKVCRACRDAGRKAANPAGESK